MDEILDMGSSKRRVVCRLPPKICVASGACRSDSSVSPCHGSDGLEDLLNRQG